MAGSITCGFTQALVSCRSANGDVNIEQLRETVEALYVTRQPLIFRYLLSIGRNSSEAEDLAQEAFLRLFDHCAAGNEVRNVLNWLLVVARNLMIDRIRTKRFERTECGRLWDRVLHNYMDQRANAEDQAIAAHQQKEVNRMLSCLTETERACLLLRSQGHPYRQIAEQLGITTWSAAHFTSRAVRKLKQRVSDGNG